MLEIQNIFFYVIIYFRYVGGFFVARKICGRINVMGGMPVGCKLRVIAWDADMDDDDHMGTATVAKDGSYSIEYTGENWDWSPGGPSTGWRPDIYVVVEWMEPLSNSWKVIGKSKVYSNHDTREDREIDLNVSLPIINSCSVYGYITDKKGEPMEGYTVTAWDEDPYAVMRAIGGSAANLPATGEVAAEFLGSAVTDGEGQYRIQYAANYWETLPRWNKQGNPATWWRPDIYIKVHNKERAGVLHRSPTNQNVIGISGIRIDAKI